MTSRVGRVPSLNPFSSRFVAPGAIAYRFPTGEGITRLVEQLEATGGWGQIIGPHGSGKSTLLATLLPNLTGWSIQHVRLNAADRELPGWVWEALPGPSLLVIDGFEQLGRFTRWRLKRHRQRLRRGLLVTAHCSMGLPDLYRTHVPPTTAQDVIAGLVPPGGEWVLEGFDVPAHLRIHGGSMREVLFELYDRWSLGR